LFGAGCDGLVCVSPEAARSNEAVRAGRPLIGCFGVVDDRFAPARDAAQRAQTRASWGIAPDDRALGIVARAQKHRRFDLLFEAMQQLVARRDRARLVVIGRGTEQFDMHRLAAEMGLESSVIFTGYRDDDYLELLQALDCFTLLVPGSDGTCRALLEASGCGLPSVVTRRGALPEIVADGETGRVVDESATALAAAWEELLFDDGLRGRLGAAARWRARKNFGVERLADEMEAFYERVRAAGNGSS
jgi:glycosyltransferase involved in cell wall biosynthesis